MPYGGNRGGKIMSVSAKAIGQLVCSVTDRKLASICIQVQICPSCGGDLEQSGEDTKRGYRVECVDCESEYYLIKKG